MKAVGYRQSGLPISDPRALEDLELPDPAAPEGRDLRGGIAQRRIGRQVERDGDRLQLALMVDRGVGDWRLGKKVATAIRNRGKQK